MIVHPIPPLYNKESKALILGSFPSVKSREVLFYYGNSQNRFWQVLSSIYNEPIPNTQEEKESLILNHHLALWDVISSCEISGSSDSSIKNVHTNDIYSLIEKSNIQVIYLNGKTAEKYYLKYLSNLEIPWLVLPSTSPANAKYHLDDLINAWKVIK